MFRALTPIFALIIAIGLGMTYIKTEFERIGAVQNQEKEYVDAIERASELKQVLAEKVAERNSYNAIDLERLNVMLPEEVKEVSVVLDLDAIARTSRMSLSNIQVSKGAGSTQQAAEGQSPAPGSESSIASRDISFTVLGTYNDFRTFVASLEKSLVFFDIVNLSFKETTGDLTAFDVTLRTYAYNPLP